MQTMNLGRTRRARLRPWPMLTALLALAASAVATQGAETGNSLTIYSSARPGAVPPELYRPQPGGRPIHHRSIPGFAMVRQDRPIELSKGIGTYRFTDVAALIDPTTVHFESLTDPDHTRVLEQNFQFDLISTTKLLQRYIDRPITVEQIVGDHVQSFGGTLLSAADGLILQDEDGQLQVVQNPGDVRLRFPALPGGLITRPTLVWLLDARRGGVHESRVTYETAGMTWWADYNLVFTDGANANEGNLDLAAWVSIVNQSGAGYADARLKLIAGDVHRAPGAAPVAPRGKMATLAMEADTAGFTEKSFFEFHLYTLGRTTDLADNSTKQIELFPAVHGVPARKLLIFDGQAGLYYATHRDPITDGNFGLGGNRKVSVLLEFANREEHDLGIPLPAGRVRVFKPDEADGSLEFIGEDVLDHTPRDEKVLIRMGSAFDLTGERKQLDFSVDTARRTMQETIQVVVRNHKKEAVEVIIQEGLHRWTNWTITESSMPYEKKDARTVRFPVKVDARGELTLRYHVRYSW